MNNFRFKGNFIESESSTSAEYYLNCVFKAIAAEFNPHVLVELKAIANLSGQTAYCKDPESSKAVIRIDTTETDGEKYYYFVLFHRGESPNYLETASCFKEDMVGSGMLMKGIFKNIYFLFIQHLEENLSHIIALRNEKEIVIQVEKGNALYIDWNDPTPISHYMKLKYNDGSEKSPAIPYVPYSAKYLIQSHEAYWQDMHNPKHGWTSEVLSAFNWRIHDHSWLFKICIELLRVATEKENNVVIQIGVGHFEDMESIELYEAIQKIENPPVANLLVALKSVRTEFMPKNIFEKHQQTIVQLERQLK